MRPISILLLIAVLFSVAAMETAHAQDRPRRDAKLESLLHLNCRDKVQEQTFQRTLGSTPAGSLRRAEILVLYSECLFRAKRREADAVPLLKEAAQILPTSAGVHRNLGWAYFEQGRDLEAIDAYERAINLAPDAETHAQLGFVLMRAVSGTLVYSKPDLFNEYMARAEEQLRRAIALSPDNSMFHSHLGGCLIGRGKSEEGIGELHRAIELAQTSKEWESPADRAFALADLNLHLGQEYWNMGRKAEGERLMNLAVEQAPNERTRKHLKLIADSTMGRVPPDQRKAELKLEEDVMRKGIFDPFEEEETSHAK